MHSTNWDDLRYVLAVAECGSVSAAARVLGVNHATVLRRIAAFEAHHNAVIFDRTPQGYAVSPDKLRLIEAAREAALAVETVGRMIRGNDSRLSGVLRVTSTDTFCLAVLPPVLAQMQAESNGLRVELLCTNTHLDLSRLDADLTVRPAPKLPDDLIGEAVAVLGFAAYGPKGRDGTLWLGLRGTLTRSPAADWMARHLPPDAVGGGSDSFVMLREMVAAGSGRAILPCCLGDADPRLQRLPDAPPLSVPIWVASHADLADAPRLRTLRSRLADGLRAQSGVLAGQG